MVKRLGTPWLVVELLSVQLGSEGSFLGGPVFVGSEFMGFLDRVSTVSYFIG